MCRFGAQCNPLEGPGQRWKAGSVWGEQGAAGAEGGWCRRTEGTGTVAGTADTVGTVASADSTPCTTWRQGRLLQAQLQWCCWCWWQGLQVLLEALVTVLYAWVGFEQMILGQGQGEEEHDFL